MAVVVRWTWLVGGPEGRSETYEAITAWVMTAGSTTPLERYHRLDLSRTELRNTIDDLSKRIDEAGGSSGSFSTELATERLVKSEIAQAAADAQRLMAELKALGEAYLASKETSP